MQTLTGIPYGPVELKLWAADQKATYDPEEGLSPAARSRGRSGDPAARGADPAAGRGDAARGRGRGSDAPVAIIGSQVITAGGGAAAAAPDAVRRGRRPTSG